LQINEEIYNEALNLIEDVCLMLKNKGLIQLGMTTPYRPMHDAFNQELRSETQYIGRRSNSSFRTQVAVEHANK
jgi:hypothetical protein